MSKVVTSYKQFPLQLWDRIEISVSRGDRKGMYVARVEDIGHDSLKATRPDFIGGYKLLTGPVDVMVSFMRPDAMYQFTARLRAIANSRTEQVELYNPGEIKRVQRRNFVRINRSLELKYRLVKKAGAESLTGESGWINSCTENISAGGMLMKANDGIQVDDLLLMRIEIREAITPGLVIARCVRLVEKEDLIYAGVAYIIREELPRHFSRSEIAELPEGVDRFDRLCQNKLVQSIFTEQIKERQKGLI